MFRNAAALQCCAVLTGIQHGNMPEQQLSTSSGPCKCRETTNKHHMKHLKPTSLHPDCDYMILRHLPALQHASHAHALTTCSVVTASGACWICVGLACGPNHPRAIQIQTQRVLWLAPQQPCQVSFCHSCYHSCCHRCTTGCFSPAACPHQPSRR